MIPKIIHHAWFGAAPFDDIFKEWRLSWVKYNHDFSFMFWNEDNLPYDKFSADGTKLLQMKLKFVVKSDIVRWELLHLFGGIWVDTDMECIRSIASLLDTESFIGETFPENRLGNSIVGTIKNNPLMAEIRDATNAAVLEDIPRSFNNLHLCKASGAIFVARNFLPKICTIYPERFFYPIRVFDTTNPRRMKNWNKSENADEYAIHHWAGTEKNGWLHVAD